VTAVAAVTLPGARKILAIGSDGGSVRLWDPTTGIPTGDSFNEYTGPVKALAAVRLPKGRVLIAISTSGGGVRLGNRTARSWDLRHHFRRTGERLSGHHGLVHAMAAVPLPNGRVLLATGSYDHTVQLWDPTTGILIGKPLTGHTC
jgi:WD40 repeat protein